MEDLNLDLGGMALWYLISILLMVVLAWGVARLMRRGGQRRQSPEEILKRRYASGEIDRQEYERTLAGLRR